LCSQHGASILFGCEFQKIPIGVRRPDGRRNRRLRPSQSRTALCPPDPILGGHCRSTLRGDDRGIETRCQRCDSDLESGGRTRAVLVRPTSSLKVNLVYDTRQKHVAVGAALDAEDAEHQAARKVLDALQYQVIEQQDSYNSDLRALTVRGGITPDERQAFETRRAAIQSLSDSLRRGVMAFNDSNAALRSKVDRFNEDAGKTFTAGRFVRDSTGERIDVFRFTSDTELIRLLAHELGHALGLDHNDDSTSIMYMMDERGNLTASEADLRSLRKLCGM
jgi:hypothetical protein